MKSAFVAMTWQSFSATVAIVLLGAGSISTCFSADAPEFRLLSPHLSPDWGKPQTLNDRLRELAGKDAVNCGRIRFGQDPGLPTGCALKAFAGGKPFYVRYDIQGIDSDVAVGFAGRNGNTVYGVFFDHMIGWGGRVLHLNVEPCPRPINLIETKSGELNCFWLSSRSLWLDE